MAAEQVVVLEKWTDCSAPLSLDYRLICTPSGELVIQVCEVNEWFPSVLNHTTNSDRLFPVPSFNANGQ